jgi:hypothetical protein
MRQSFDLSEFCGQFQMDSIASERMRVVAVVSIIVRKPIGGEEREATAMQGISGKEKASGEWCSAERLQCGQANTGIPEQNADDGFQR